MPVAENNASELHVDSTRSILSPETVDSSSGMRRRTAAQPGIQRASLRQRAVTLMRPEKKVGPGPTIWKSIQAIIFASTLNVLLVCIPISWALNFALPHQPMLIFVFSFLAIIPLSKLLAFATDELSIRVGQTLAGLIKATLGNAVGLIVSIIALVKCELVVVQSALVGSILCNLLFVLGMCFFVGGLRFSEQYFATVVAQMNSALLTISVVAVLLPGAFTLFLHVSDLDTTELATVEISRAAAIVLLFVYASYLFFHLFSHKDHYQDHSMGILEPKKYDKNPFKIGPRDERAATLQYTETPLVTSQQWLSFSALWDRTSTHQPTSDPEFGHVDMPVLSEEEVEEPRMSVLGSFTLLISVAVLVAVTADFMLDANNDITTTGHISKKFTGIILFPVVGNTAEHITTVTDSVKDMTLSLSTAVGSSIQMALFVIPLVITLGWIIGKPLTLLFDPFESIVLFFSAHTVNYILWRGRSNWLDGMILMCFYLILCVIFWYYPGVSAALTC